MTAARPRRASALGACGGVALLLAACGGPAAPARPTVAQEVPLAPKPPERPPVDAGDPLPSLAELAAAGPRVAPGFELFAQGEVSDGRAIPLARAEDDDICLRGVFAADAPVRATLALAGGETLTVTGGVDRGVLGKAGPVCARRGSAVVLQFYGAATRTRYVVWVARTTR